MNVHRFSSEALFLASALAIVKQCCQKTGTIRIALSGGTTPQQLYALLAVQNDIPFEKIELYQADERYVPSHHPDSNKAMIEEKLITQVHDRVREWHYFDTSLPLETCAESYHRLLSKNLVQQLDLSILGIGTDGHIASIFSHSPALTSAQKAIPTETEAHTIRERLTITLPIILASHRILVLLGPGKQSVITELETGNKSPDEFPAKYLLSHPRLDILHRER